MALALIRPVFELIVLSIAILPSDYGRRFSSIPVWNHGPLTLLSLNLYPRPALLLRHCSKWSSMSTDGIYKFLMHLCVNCSSVLLLPLVVCTYVSHCREQRGNSDAGNIFRIMILSGISHRLHFNL